MKKIFILVVFSLTIYNFVYAQSSFIELNEIKQIKLLESSREDVEKIFAGYSFVFSDVAHHSQLFTTKTAYVDISYSTGNCSDNSEIWNVSEWKVTTIEISPKNPIEVKDIEFDFSKFRKERHYINKSDSYVYHKKDLGIAFEIDKNQIQKIFLFPSKINPSFFCDNKTARKFISNKSWFGGTKLKDRELIIEDFFPAVDNLILSTTEITADCSDSEQNKGCSDCAKEILVNAVVQYTPDDALTYVYHVSAGKIIGNGSKVIWDLRGVKPGTYTITVSADDGCDVCGKTTTRTVVVKECI